MFLLGYDTETTSNRPETTRVVQVAAVRREEDGTKTVILNQLCNPGTDISDGAREVHGISNEMVKDAEPDSAVMKRLYQYVKENHEVIIVVGHNIVGFDLPILFTLGGERIPILWIDTLVCATRVFPEAESHKLSDLVQWLQLGSNENAHDALADIEMVFLLLDHIRNGLNKDWLAMAEWCMTPRVLKRAHFGKHKGKLWGRAQPGEASGKYVPAPYVRFICEKFDPTPDLVATIRHHYGMRFKKRSAMA